METSENTATQKVGARFTSAEVELLELVTTALGVSVSSYLRKALKTALLDDLLAIRGHHSSFRSAKEISEATELLQETMDAMKTHKANKENTNND